MSELVPSLVVYGPLGIFCAALMYAVVKLYWSKEKQAKSFQEQIDRLVKDHREEMSAMTRRHIEKAETWVAKQQEQTTSMTRLLDLVAGRRNNDQR